MKKFMMLAIFAFAVLAAAAVWLGSLNQDEGWYLYAARLVGEGRMPYRDFFYTQGPLMPCVYSSFSWIWRAYGLLGARIATCAIGFVSICLFAAFARLVAPPDRRNAAAAVAFMLLGCNLYHVYYTAIPKTYALASVFVAVGFFLCAHALVSARGFMRGAEFAVSGLAFAFASGTRISLGAILAVVGFSLLFSYRRNGLAFLWFGLGGAAGLAAAYGPYLIDGEAFAGLCAAQRYHASRSGFDIVFTLGSVSRLVRWYMPVFIFLGLGALCAPGGSPAGGGAECDRDAGGAARRFVAALAFASFCSVFFIQMLAPFPYEDYQVPVMGLAAASAAAFAARVTWLRPGPLAILALGLAWASSFGSPLLEKWTTDGQDRFWTVKKQKSELAQLRDAAQLVEALDPGGGEILTQDLYIAVETGRRVPDGLEMGPFSILTDEEWRRLLQTCECRVAALSGYTFAIDPPSCEERPVDRQIEYWSLLKPRYDLVTRIYGFGQNSTTLTVLRRKDLK